MDLGSQVSQNVLQGSNSDGQRQHRPLRGLFYAFSDGFIKLFLKVVLFIQQTQTTSTITTNTN